MKIKKNLYFFFIFIFFLLRFLGALLSIYDIDINIKFENIYNYITFFFSPSNKYGCLSKHTAI